MCKQKDGNPRPSMGHNRIVLCLIISIINEHYKQTLNNAYSKKQILIVFTALKTCLNIQTVEVATAIGNPDFPFNNPSFNNDWVILKLASPLTLNENVQPACLPDASLALDHAAGEKCYVSGWGRRASGGRPDILNWVDVLLLTNDQCSEVRKL